MMLLRLAQAVSERARRARMRRFVETFGATESTRVLDVGGTPGIWRLAPVQPRVVFLNEPREEAASTIYGDGCCLPFRDGAFDVVFSNSVIEHVGGAERQAEFAREAARAGRGYWVQTPNRRFPVETHLLTPFIHWLPRAWQTRLAPKISVWRWLARVSEDRREFYLRHYLDRVHLLTAAEMRKLFPDAAVVNTGKSLIAYRLPPKRA